MKTEKVTTVAIECCICLSFTLSQVIKLDKANLIMHSYYANIVL